MVKQKLTDKEKEVISEQLKQFVKPKTLPDIIRKALLRNNWFPEKYTILIPDEEGKQQFVNAKEALDALDRGEITDLHKEAIAKILEVPKIKNRIDYEYYGLLTDVKNEQVQKNIFGETVEKPKKIDKNVRLHEKAKHVDVTGNEQESMKGMDAKPIIHSKEGSKFDDSSNRKQKGETNDTTNKESHNNDSSPDSGREGEGTGEGSSPNKSRRTISFDSDEDN